MEQLSESIAKSAFAVPPQAAAGGVGETRAASFAEYRIIRRNGAVVGFEPAKIAIALTKAFIAVNGGQGAASARVREIVEQLTGDVVRALLRRQPAGGTFHIEDVQDQVELALMRSGEHEVARAYVLYRERRSAERAAQKQVAAEHGDLHAVDGGQRVPLPLSRIEAIVRAACEGFGEQVSAEAILKETVKNLYDGVQMDEVFKSMILAARALIEKDPAYSQVTARLLLHTERKLVLGEEVLQGEMATRYEIGRAHV